LVFTLGESLRDQCARRSPGPNSRADQERTSPFVMFAHLYFLPLQPQSKRQRTQLTVR